MSTFYGGEQLVSVFALNLNYSSNQVGTTAYTIPAGHVAYIKQHSANSSGTSDAKWFMSDAFGNSSLVDFNLSGNLEGFDHPNAGNSAGADGKMWDEGTALKVNVATAGNASAKLMVYLYKKP